MQQKPVSPFELMEFHGNTITLDTNGKILVLPTGDPDILPMYNECTKDTHRDYTGFGGYNGDVPDYCPGTVYCQTEGVLLTDPSGNHSGSVIGAGVLKAAGYLAIDTDAHTITEEVIVKNNTIESESVIDDCSSTTGWSIIAGTGTSSSSDGKLVINGTPNETHELAISKNFSTDISAYKFLKIKLKSSVNNSYIKIRMGATGNHKRWIDSRYTLQADVYSDIILPIYAPQGASGSYPNEVTGSFNPTNLTQFVVAVANAGTSCVLTIDSITVCNPTHAYIETYVPNALKPTSLSIYAHNGTAYQLCSTHSLNGAYSQLSQTSANCTFTDSTKFDDVYGSAGAGRAVFPKGSSGDTVAGSSGNITYSTLQGAANRIGIMVDLPPYNGIMSNFSKVQLKFVIGYEADSDGIYSTTNILSKSSDTSTGLDNLIKPYMLFYDPENNYIDTYLFSKIPKNIIYKKNESGTIYEITIEPNGSVYHGSFSYPDLDADFDSDDIPDFIDATCDGSVIKSLFSYSTLGVADLPDAPVIAEVTAVPTPGSDPTPQYTFSTTKAGRIKYINCSSSTKYATVGNNTITFDGLELGVHDDCRIIVYDKYGVSSNVISITPFTIESPTLYIVPAISDSKFLPNSPISDEFITTSTDISLSPGESTPISFIVNNRLNDVSNISIYASDLISNSKTIDSENIDISVLKCWWQGGYGVINTVDVVGRFLTPELLLKNENLVNSSNEKFIGYNNTNINICNTTTGWSIYAGTGVISLVDNVVSVSGYTTNDSTGHLRISKTFSAVNLSSKDYLIIKMKSSISGYAALTIFSDSTHYSSWVSTRNYIQTDEYTYIFYNLASPTYQGISGYADLSSISTIAIGVQSGLAHIECECTVYTIDAYNFTWDQEQVGVEFSPKTISNPNGENSLLVNESYIDISDGNTLYTNPLVIPLNDRDIQDSEIIQPVALLNNENKQFLSTIHIPDDAEPGEYTGTISISKSGVVINEIILNVTVLPINLLEPNIEYSIYYRGKITTSGSISSESKTEEQFTAEMEDLYNHGITNPTIYETDVAKIPKLLEIRQSTGINNSNIYLVMVSYGSNSSTFDNIKTLIGSYGVENIYIYGVDEQALDDEKITSAHAAGLKVFCAEYLKERADPTYDNLDLLIAGDHWADTISNYHANNNKVYLYNRPQTVPEYPRTFRLNYGLNLWQRDYDGSMDYAYQHSFGDIWNDFDCSQYRDHNFTYPTANGVIDTIQWEGFREGVTDMRYLATLQKAIEDYPGTSATEAQGWLDTLKTTSLTNADLDGIRAQMQEYILEITGA